MEFMKRSRNWKIRKSLAGQDWILDLFKGAGLVLILAWLFYDSIYAVFLMLPLLWFWYKECEKERKQKKEEHFKRMFREWILLLSSSLSAGYSVENAFLESYRELKAMFPKGGIMLDELQIMLSQLQNRQTPEMIMTQLAMRHPVDEVLSFTEVFCASRKSGGSLSAIIKSTAGRMAEIMDTRREIRTMLSARVYEQKVMTMMPLGVLLYVRIGISGFMKCLYHNPAGIFVMTACLGVYLAAYLMGKKLVAFEI